MDMFSNLDVIKKNPLSGQVQIIVQGLIGKLTFDLEVFKVLKKRKE